MRVYEGDILTVDAQDSVARYLVEDDGRILFVGDDLPAEYEEVPVEHLGEREHYAPLSWIPMSTWPLLQLSMRD